MLCKYILILYYSDPELLFDDFIELQKEEYYPVKEKLQNISSNMGFKFSMDTSKDEYLDCFKKEPYFLSISEDYQNLYYNDMIKEEKKKLKDEKRKKKKIIREYKDYLNYKFKKKIEQITWSEAKEVLVRRSVYKDLNDEILAEELFQIFKDKTIERNQRKKNKKERVRLGGYCEQNFNFNL